MSATIPEQFPIFPLPNVVLFPDVLLPLHIFEARYRAMTADALTAERVIGMVLLRPGADAAAKDAPIFEVGCAGVIGECERRSDGRYNLVLRGERRFRIVEERATVAAYRVVRARLLEDPSQEDLAAPMRGALLRERDRLEALVLELAAASAPGSVDQVRAQVRALDPIALVHALAFAIDCAPLEKQGLLEARDPLERCRLLIQLFEFRRAEMRFPQGPRILN
jgi:Lon protease-like protein